MKNQKKFMIEGNILNLTNVILQGQQLTCKVCNLEIKPNSVLYINKYEIFLSLLYDNSFWKVLLKPPEYRIFARSENLGHLNIESNKT